MSIKFPGFLMLLSMPEAYNYLIKQELYEISHFARNEVSRGICSVYKNCLV
ncbi:MAG: hypothetical protein PHI36_00735 [Bacteroidales bacterium]|nr:hypothetical protein [Bacteroidales bacterium]MDD4574930.1 hypothetical protein [Bacteroidales bacterium]